MLNTLDRLKPYLILGLFVVVFFRKSFFQGLIPIPFDLLVSWFFPYNSGGWWGAWTIHKGGNFASDAIRQTYPWKQLAIDLIKQGKFPLWNPYAFSGTPLLANFQSAIFYPLNAFFFLIDNFPYAWALYIISTLILSSVFMYLFLKSLKLKNLSALLGSLAFAASGYMTVWLEWGSVSHQLVWLPLSLFSLNRWWQSKKKRYLVLLILSASSTIFAGYPQGAAYNFIIVLSFLIFLANKTSRKRKVELILPVLIAGLLTIAITAVQWLPTAELYFHSAMKGEASQKLSKQAALPFLQLVTFLSPDYFGNRVTDNYWAKEFSGVDYMDADLYLGAVSLLLAGVALIGREKKAAKKWLITLILLGLFLGIKTPVVTLVANLGIPVISTGAAAEALLISIFAISVLAALGLETFAESKKVRVKPAIEAVAILYGMLFIATFFMEAAKASIARKALVVPALAVGPASILIFIKAKARSQHKQLTAWLVIAILGVELLVHAEKILPFSTPDFAFPEHVLIEELGSRSGNNRVAGFWETEIATNFHTAFRLFSSEGYDPLYSRRYGEFMSAADEGKLPKSIPRSDADITMENQTNRNRLIDLTSTRFISAKVTDPDKHWEQEPLKYDPSRFELVWQKQGFKIYENLQALARIKLYYDWQVLSDDRKIIETLYDQQFNPHEQVLLEKNPGIEPSGAGEGSVKITNYQSATVEIDLEGEKPAILLLTDSFYPGWKARIDDKPVEILRANYTFRALVVPEGNHKIIFYYHPRSFIWGAVISILAASLLISYTAIFVGKGYYKARRV